MDLGSGENEVAETAVEWLLQVQVIVRVDEVSPVQVSIDAEHLAEDGLADIEEIVGETATLSKPVTRA